MSATAPPMMPPVIVSDANQPPGYPWFQQQQAAADAQQNIVEMNHLASQNEASRQRISYGDQDRTDKVGFANREAIERNGLGVLTSVERNAGENRVTTLQASADARAQTSANFATTLLSLKDNQIAAAANVGEAKSVALEQALRAQGTLLRESAANRDATGAVALQSAVQTGDLKNQNSWQHGLLRESQERGFARVEVQAAHIRNDQEKAFALLGIQAERLHGDTNRRMANYRAETDRRVDAIGAAILLQAANNKNEVLLAVAAAAKAAAECCCETKQLVQSTAATTQGLVSNLDAARIRDALAAAQQEALLLRMSHGGERR